MTQKNEQKVMLKTKRTVLIKEYMQKGSLISFSKRFFVLFQHMVTKLTQSN